MRQARYIKYANALYRLAETYVVENHPQHGKFDDALSEWLYEKTLDGWSSEELGDAETFGHYALLVFDTPVVVKEAQPGSGGTSGRRDQDWSFLAAVVATDSQGFVYYRPFDTVEEAKAAWAKLEQAYAESEEEEPEAGVMTPLV